MVTAPFPVPLLEDSDGDRQIETSRAGARGVEVPDPLQMFVVRKVAVTEHHDIRRLSSQLFDDPPIRPLRAGQDVREEELQPSDLAANNLLARCVIIVSRNSGNGSDPFEGTDDVVSPDVARMKNHVDTRKGLDCLWTHQPVSVGNDSD